MLSDRVRSLVPGRESPFSEATVFNLLQNRRRRFALHHLKQQGEPVPAGELAARVAAWETGVAPEAVDPSDRKRVHVSLLQSHLPAMEEAGVVERDGEAVSLTDAAADIDVYVELMARDDLLWEEYYLALGALSAGFLALPWLEIYPFTVVGDRLWLALVVVLFAVSAGVHHLSQRQARIGADGPPPDHGRST